MTRTYRLACALRPLHVHNGAKNKEENIWRGATTIDFFGATLGASLICWLETWASLARRLVGAKLLCASASAAPFSTGRWMPGALPANNTQAHRRAHDKWEREGKKSGRGGSKTGSGVADRWGERTRGGERCNDVEERQSNKRWGREMSIQLKVCFEKLALISDCNRTLFLISSPRRRAESAGWLFTGRAEFAKWIRDFFPLQIHLFHTTSAQNTGWP